MRRDSSHRAEVEDIEPDSTVLDVSLVMLVESDS